MWEVAGNSDGEVLVRGLAVVGELGLVCARVKNSAQQLRRVERCAGTVREPGAGSNTDGNGDLLRTG